MLVQPFNRLLTGTLSSNLRWQKANLCPCIKPGGDADQTCAVCMGSGRFYNAWSGNFRAGFIGQDSRSLAAIMQKMGPGEVGDAVLVVPITAPCFNDLGPRDRIMALDVTDLEEKALTPSTPAFTLPPGIIQVGAYIKSTDGLSTVPTAFPTPDSNNRVQVSVTTVLRYRIPRLYEIVRELPHVRTFPARLPKKVSLKRIDMTER